MVYNRRKFIKHTGGITGGVFLAQFGVLSALNSCGGSTLSQFGIQLYTLRDVIQDNTKEVLKQLSSFGYKQIESYEGPEGMFWGMSNSEFSDYLNGLGMKMVSSHVNIDKDFEKKAEQAAAIGMKYLICPYIGPQKTADDYKKFAEKFNNRGAVCKKNGIGFAYHNHDYSFKMADGQFPQDIMMNNTDPSLVDFEMDIYWVVVANQDPEVWLKKYKNRFRLCHIKDYSKTPVTDNGKNSVDLGTGVIDFSSVLKTAKSAGMTYYLVEQEAYPNGSSLKSAKADADFLKDLKI